MDTATMDYSYINESCEANESESIISREEIDIFPELEMEFNAIQRELDDRPDMPASFKIYQALFDQVYQVREKAIQKAKINRELNDKLASTEAKLQVAYEKILHNAATIEMLDRDVEIKHQLVDEAHAREQFTCEIIDNMKKTIQQLEREQLEHRELDQMGDEDVVIIQKSSMEKDCEKLMRKVELLNEKLRDTITCQEQLERKTDEYDNQIEDITEKLYTITEEFYRYRNIKMRKHDDFERIKRELSFTENEKALLTHAVTGARSRIVYLDKTFCEQRAGSVYCIEDLVEWNRKFCKLQIACDKQIHKIQALKFENYQTTVGINYQDALEERLRKQMDVIRGQKEVSLKKGKQLEKDSIKISMDLQELRRKFNELNLSEEKSIMMRYKREYICMLRLRNMIITNINKQKRLVDKGFDLIAIRDGEKRQLEDEILSYHERTKQQGFQIVYLKKQLVQLREQAEDREFDREDLADLMAQLKINVYRENKKLHAQQIRWRILNESYNSLLMDKRAFMTMFQAALDKNMRLTDNWRKKDRIVSIAYTAMKRKECAVLDMKEMTARLQNEINDMRNTLKQSREEVRKLREEYSMHRKVVKGLRDTIATIKIRIKRNNETIEMLISEGDILSAQTQARNSELFLLYKKLNLTCEKTKYGALRYKRRLEDIKLLKREIKRLRIEKAHFYEKISNVADNKSEIMHLHRDLSIERIKISTLEEEMKNTVVNVHRWRTLEKRDPLAFQMLQWVGLAQKKNVRIAQKVATKQMLLKEITALYNTLRKMAAKQPGPATYNVLESKRKCLKEARKVEEELKSDIKKKELDHHVCVEKLKMVGTKVHEVRMKISRLKRYQR